MTIAGIRCSVRFLCVAVTMALVPGIGGMPVRAVLADEQDAEDPAEVQRRQQIQQQANHWEQPFTKLLWGDLELLRAVCGNLPRESRRAIAKAGEQAVKDAALRMAEMQMGDRRPGGKPADEKNSADPTGMVAAALVRSIAEHAGKEQQAAFAEQLARREDRRREAMIRTIVAALDGELFLTAGQRQAIEESLREKWDDSMATMLQGVQMHKGVRVFPGLPEACVSPHLSAAQRERFVAGPRGNEAGRAHSRQQAWMQTVDMLNNEPSAARDPWWFQ